MLEPSKTDDEERRLQALRALRIMDSPQEDRFDRLTRLATHLFDVPMALVALVGDDRVWFKSRCGVDVAEIPRKISFSAHVIRHDGLFQVGDAANDVRFHDSPLVTGHPFARFFAGVPLSTRTGVALGALCILDTAPRQLSAGDREALSDLAEAAERELQSVHLVSRDELTNLYNARGFRSQARQNLALCARSNIPACLAWFSIQGFEYFPETDAREVLVEFARGMRVGFRESDLVGRLGEHDFAALLTRTNRAGAHATIRRFRAALARTCAQSKHGLAFEFRQGLIEVHHSLGFTLETLLEQVRRDMQDGERREREERLAPRAGPPRLTVLKGTA